MADLPETPQDQPGEPETYQVGTLVYTKAGLTILFFWLLWGDFCYQVMEAVTNPIMQLKFQSLHASNTEIGVIIGTIPGIVYSIFNPMVSFRSDRYRGRLGRRIPFLLFSMPFVVTGLLGLAFGSQIAFWLHAHVAFLGRMSADQLAIVTLGVLLVYFAFFNTFVNSTFWYLFNDVVPEHLMARFMSFFRFISTLTASMYSFFIFPYSGSHSTVIFVGAALLYLVGFGLMCINVREGKYPPPPPYIGGKTGPIAALATYAGETHAFPHYWYLWICTFLGGIAGGGAVLGPYTMFGLFYMQSIGLSLAQIGAINGVISFAGSIMTLGAGWLADRYHPIRVVVAGAFGALAIVTPATMVFLFWHPSPKIAFITIMAISVGLMGPSVALASMWDPPMLMRLFPRSRFGQFCSVNGVWRMVGGMCGGALTGVFLDVMTRFVGKKQAYFYLPVWSFVFGVPSFLLLLKLYQSWKRHGGDDDYVAPVPDKYCADAPLPSPLPLVP